jgi:hypothetical protein
MKPLTLKRIAVAASLAVVLSLVVLASLPAKPGSVQLVSPRAIVRTSGMPMTRLTLTNAGWRKIVYWGYGPDNPWYSYEFQGLGGPTNYCPFWCGTGLRSCELRPRQSVDIDVLNLDQSTYRVSLEYTQPGMLDKIRSAAPVWIAQKLPRAKALTVLSAPLKGAPNWTRTSSNPGGQSLE